MSKVPRSISASVWVAVEPLAVWNMIGSQVRCFKFILSAFLAEIRSCPLPESKMNLRSLACTGNEMHIMFLDFLRDFPTSCSTSSSVKTKSSWSLSNLINMSNLGPMMILTSSTKRWSPHLSMMIALARARTEPRVLSDLDWSSVKSSIFQKT